jgi:hypothetical protein
MHANDFCWGCVQNEPAPEGGAYRICGECGHVYGTPEDLVREDYELWVEISYTNPEFLAGSNVPTRPPEEIYSCPICTHDF